MHAFLITTIFNENKKSNQTQIKGARLFSTFFFQLKLVGHTHSLTLQNFKKRRPKYAINCFLYVYPLK